MKELIKIFFKVSLPILFIHFTACVSTESVTVTTIHLQDATVSGPINQAPIHLTKETETPFFTVSPRFSYTNSQQVNAYVSGHTPVNSEGVFQVDTVFYTDGSVSFNQANGANIYEYDGQNLTWDIASVTAGIDFDARITKSFAAFGGVNYSSTNNKNAWGGTAGLAVLMTSGNIGLRLDAGLHVQEIAYDAYTVEIIQTGNNEYVVFYHDLGKSTHWDPFINFTVNSTFPNSFVNFFLNVGYSQQTLVGFKPEDKDETYYGDYKIFYIEGHREIVEDLRGEATASYFTLTPGLFFRIGRSSRILLGVRCMFDSGLDDSTASTFILPMMQVDFMF
jgi:hypothetical protein